MGGKYTAWSAADDARLRDMAATAAGWADVAAAMGRTYRAVKTRACDLGIRLDPQTVKARRSATVAASRGTPESRAKSSASGKAAWDDDRRKRSGEMARANNSIAYALAKRCTEDHRVAGVRASAARRRSWCPDYLWPEYRRLQISKQIRCRDARQLVLADFARDLSRALKSIAAAAKPLHEEQRRQYHSFEAELERAKARGIREVVPMVRAEYHLSLTGGSL